MKANNKSVIRSEKRLIAIKQQYKAIILKATTPLCYNCERNAISPYESQLCDMCADEIRFRPRLSDLD